MEQEKIIKLLDFLTTEADIEIKKEGIIVKNFQYNTFIKIEGLPDWNYKIEFALKTERNPFKKLGENKGESFVLPYVIMKSFLEGITEEINRQRNKEIIDEYGISFFNNKKNEIFKILNSDLKVDEEYQSYTLCYKTDLFNNVMIIEKPEYETSILNHEFIKLGYTYLVPEDNENLNTEDNKDLDVRYKTQTINLYIPAIEIENYKILTKILTKPIKNDYASLIDVLRNNNKDEKMSKLLLYTKLDVDLESHKKVKLKTSKI